jgi:hypothetical protein
MTHSYRNDDEGYQPAGKPAEPLYSPRTAIAISLAVGILLIAIWYFIGAH